MLQFDMQNISGKKVTRKILVCKSRKFYCSYDSIQRASLKLHKGQFAKKSVNSCISKYCALSIKTMETKSTSKTEYRIEAKNYTFQERIAFDQPNVTHRSRYKIFAKANK